MATKQKKSNSVKQESAETLVRKVLTTVFKQNPSQKIIAEVTAKVVKSLPKEAA